MLRSARRPRPAHRRAGRSRRHRPVRPAGGRHPIPSTRARHRRPPVSPWSRSAVPGRPPVVVGGAWQAVPVAASGSSRGTRKSSAPSRPTIPPHELRPAPVVLVTGGEGLLADRAVAAVIAAAREADAETEVERLDAATYDAGRLTVATSPSLFGGGKVVIVDAVDKANDALVGDATAYLRSPDPDACVVLRHNGGQRAKGAPGRGPQGGRPRGVLPAAGPGRREGGLRRRGVPAGPPPDRAGRAAGSGGRRRQRPARAGGGMLAARRRHRRARRPRPAATRGSGSTSTPSSATSAAASR